MANLADIFNKAYNDYQIGQLNRVQARYADPMAAAELQGLQTKLKYLDPTMAADLYEKQTKNKYLDKGLAADLYKAETENKYLPEKLRLGNENIKASINERNFFQNNPLLKMPGAAGQIGAALYLQNKGNGGLAAPLSDNNSQPQPLVNIPDAVHSIMDNMNALVDARKAAANLNNKRAENMNWAQLPAETKNNIIAQGLGMGVDPNKMKDYINQGLNFQDIAKKEGLDPDNLPPPIYYPTNTTKTRVQQVQQVGNELDYLASATTPIIKRYADTFAGISTARLSDMLSSDPEAQKRFGQYIGALSVQTGLANGRVLLEGGKAGVEIMREVKSSALKGIDTNSPIKMSGVAFDEAQKTIDRILQRGAKIRTMTGMSPFSKNQQSPNESAKKDPKDMTIEEIKAELAQYE